ncbi:MAG TPA: tetratricopeptide repeat protein [Blastocatellia bacterium]|nr:tetratricopeptide repeat protein [Blastocatellia bacterium]
MIVLLVAIFVAAAAGYESASAAGLDPGNYPAIVTMPFENLSGRPEYNWLGEGFASALADLLDKPGLLGISPDERDVAYRQEGLPPTAILTRATMIKIAERSGANLVVMGNYRISGDGRDSTVAINARVVDLREGRLVGREHSYGGPILDVQRLIGELAYEILYQQNPALSFSREQIVWQAAQPPIGAFESYIKGKLTRDPEARAAFLDKAIKEYADKGKGSYAAAIFELGRTRYQAGEFAPAIDQLEKIDERDPRFPETLFYIGAARDSLGQTDKALEAFVRLAPILPLFEVYNNIGVLHIKKKNYAEAVSHLKPAVEAAPRDTDTLFNLGYASFLAGDFKSAEASLQREIERRPSDGEAFYLLSKSLANTGDRAKATEAADQAKKLLSAFAQWETKGIPQVGRIKTSFSMANYYRYKRDKATESANGLQAPENEQLLASARAAFFAGRDEDALAALGKLLQISPQSYDAHLLMGRLYERRGDFERAANSLKAAVFWNPRLVAAQVLLGRIAVLKNDCKAAESSVSKALQLDQNDQDAQALKRLVEQKCKQ